MNTTDTNELAVTLTRLLQAFPFAVSEKQQQQLLDFVLLIDKWNKAYNLTSVRSPIEMLIKHIADSLAVLPHLRGKRFIDVGTGPGLPGIPLAIMLPDAEFVLLDSLGKRVRFMRQCEHELGLANITPVQSRVEQFHADVQFDGVISRAFASLKDMLHWCQHLVDSKGAFFALKGQALQQEIDEMGEAFICTDIISLDVPELHAERHLVVIKKRDE